MPIKKIKVTNFKSFDQLEVELDALNILIGANASGKSNFLQIFKFLKDISHHGLKNAISLQGGVEYLRNTAIGSSKSLSLEIIYKSKSGIVNWEMPVKVNGQDQKRPIARHFYEQTYRFTLEFTKQEAKYRVVEDKFIRKLWFCEAEKLEQALAEKRFSSGMMIFSNVDGKLEYEFVPETVLPQHENIVLQLSDVSALLNVMQLKSTELLFMETSHFDLFNPFENAFRNISIYDFDPKLPKKAVPIAGKVELEEDANNLAIVLRNILEDEEQKRKYINLLKSLLPLVVDLRVERFADKYLLFSLQEKYIQASRLPASAISDGTINIIALLVALYFEEKPIIIIEEPERNIHPFLISKVVQMLEEASTQKQIIVTTHNPEIVRHAELENIFLVSRDKDGFSTISRPAQKEAVRIFLENEVAIEDIYIQDLLGV
jgi:predicted ATPase